MQVKGYLTTEEIDAYLEKTGRRGAEVLSILGKNNDFVRAFKSELGQSLLADAVEESHSLLQLIYEDKATVQQKAEFRAYKRIISLWTKRINAIDKNIKAIKRIGKKQVIS